ncbi:MAG: RNA-binding cell elongation regulator Jag/EloR [Desulfatiglandales bacterium]
METYEFEGKTTEDAIKNASRELNIPEEELNIDVIEPGSAGIFGLVGGKKAKIRVTVKEDVTTEEEELGEGEPGEEETGFEDAESGSDESLAVAEETLEKILSLIPMETEIKGRVIDGKIALGIQGDKSGLLIGRKGKTLDALQFIVNKIVNKTLDRKVNVIIDSEDYRKRREESLIQLALKMGDKAKRIRKPVTTSPMNPHDRRIVHLALKEDGRLDTRSRGEGLFKKVVIIPKR